MVQCSDSSSPVGVVGVFSVGVDGLVFPLIKDMAKNNQQPQPLKQTLFSYLQIHVEPFLSLRDLSSSLLRPAAGPAPQAAGRRLAPGGASGGRGRLCWTSKGFR